MKPSSFASQLERIIFARRGLVIALFAVMTLFMGWSAFDLKIDAGFNKLVPMQHEYMQTFNKHKTDFGGANQVLVALTVKDGDIFTPEFFTALQQVSDDIFFLPGVNRSRVSSLFTPDSRYTAVTEEGFEGGPIIPADFRPDAAGLEQVRQNVLKSTHVGRLVANDFTGAMIKAELQEIDPTTGEKIDYVAVGHRLDEIRQKYQNGNLNLHVIGFAKVVTDMTDGAGRVLMFFALAFIITALMVYRFTRAFRITIVPLLCSVAAVIWQLGLLPLLGFGIDPMGILVPFLIFAIAVSHGVQMVSTIGAEIHEGVGHEQAARNSFRRLLAPGIIALASDTIGFLTIYLIDIRVIQEMAVTASLGVAVIILTNLVLLPVCMSYMRYGKNYRDNLHRRAEKSHVKWVKISRITQPKPAAVVICVAALLGIFGAWKGSEIKIGDMHQGIPELRQNSTYNLDSAVITKKFSVGVDVLSVFAETKADGCIDFAAMDEIDRMAWHLQNVPGVQSAVSMPGVVKISNAGWNEGALGWRTIPRGSSNLSQAISFIPQSTGLRNQDCSVMPIYLFTKDHKAETITRIVDAAKEYNAANPSELVKFTLAGNNVGVMAATNEEVAVSQFPILLYVFGAVILLCLITFRSIRATLCILIPLALVSLLGYALMAMLEIGLKVNTLPVVALGVGVGVDYGIYIYSRLESILKEGHSLRRAYEMTLDITGNGVILTGLTLGAGVATWIFSPLKFQADMGILLTFLFIVNMLGAIILLPALACWLLPKSAEQKQPEAVGTLRECA